MRPRNIYKATRTIRRHCFRAAQALFVCLALSAQAGEQTAEIALTLRYPAGESGSPQPTGLYVDARTGDIFVVDATTARIAIYDAQRQFNFEFSTRDRLTSPRYVAVDSQGRIFVSGDSRQHTVGVFDYNGEFLQYLDLAVNDTMLSPLGLAIDDTDNLHVLSAGPLRVNVYTVDGTPVRDYVVFPEGEEETRNTGVVGNFAIANNEIFLPLPIDGNVACFDLNGNLIRMYGTSGGGPGELSFPAATLPLKQGGFAVVDKHRHSVLFYAPDGRFTHEIGGAGLSEGWFFHPTTLAVCTDGTILVGQSYHNFVQSVTVQPVVSGS